MEAEADPLSTRPQVAALLGMSLDTIDNWSDRKRGLKYIRFSKRAVRFRWSDFQKFIQAHEVVRLT